MGTRSLTIVTDERGNDILTMYRQFDGYYNGHGKELAELCSGGGAGAVGAGVGTNTGGDGGAGAGLASSITGSSDRYEIGKWHDRGRADYV